MPWHAGDRVIVRGAEWRVLDVTSFVDCQALDLDGAVRGTARTLLVPFDRPRRPPHPRLTVVSRRRWARTVQAAVLRSYPFGGLRFCPDVIRLLAYQLEPALAFLRHGATRVLVADGVGLGKTIEAGLIVHELVRQDRSSRTLILCPAALRAQWSYEMRRLFDVPTVEASAGWLRRVVREVPAEVNPWSLPGVYLASIDFVKRPEALRPLEDVRWDLLVVDEAHVATCGSDRRVAIDALASRARRLMLLTATPHSGDDEQFRALCALGRAGDPLVFFSRERSDTPLGPSTLRSRVLAVRLSREEQHVHRLLDAYTRRLWVRSERAGRDARLVATVLSKRALSSPASLALSIERRRTLLFQSPAAPAQMMLPLDDLSIDDETPDGVLGAAGLDDRDEETRMLDAIAAAARAALHGERKVRALLRLVRRIREPVLVFSEYRDTAMRLGRLLAAAGHEIALLHGGMAEDERSRAVAALASGRSHLIATDAASEGLNLQQACRLVVHFELPWTPSRLHQRCGRVDRIGQARRVHEIALVACDTSEQLVLAPLVTRAWRAGAMRRQPLLQRLGESQVAAHVLGGRPLESAPFELPPGTMRMDLRTEGEAEVDRLERLRRLRCGSPSTRGRPRPATSVIPVTVIRRSPVMPAGLHVVFGIEVRQGAGAALMYEVLVLSCDVSRGWHRGHLAMLRRQVAEAIDAHDQLASRIARSVAERLAHVQPLTEAVVRRLRARAEAAERGLRSGAEELVQAGLFDRRALDALARRRRARAIHLEHERARTPTVNAGDGLEGRHDLLAVLIIGGPS